MRIGVTKLRVAMTALFVLAGVGLGSLLSPLVGTALATVGQTVNISEPIGIGLLRPRLSSDGKLAVGDGAGPLSVDGAVASRPTPPATPWRSLVDIAQRQFITLPNAVDQRHQPDAVEEK